MIFYCPLANHQPLGNLPIRPRSGPNTPPNRYFVNGTFSTDSSFAPVEYSE